MFRIIRYIIILVAFMLGLFFLHKNSEWFQDKIETTKLFFKTIGSDTKVSPDDIYNQINNQDFTGRLATTTKTSVKSYTSSTVEKPKVATAKISIDGIIYYTNIEREKAGLKPLAKNIKLNKSASAKTDDMFKNQYFEHTSPDGQTAADLVKQYDYKFQIVGENLALGIFDTDKSLVQAWMNSPAHKANILNSKYTEIGAAVGIGDYKSQRQWMAVQHFGKPLPECKEIDGVGQKNIDTEKLSLEAEGRELQKMAGVIESDSSTSKGYIDTYNARVSEYNDRLNKLRDTIAAFNKTIVEYNACVKK
ncbi:hypothetical protein H7X65_02310 [Candidatus Parcubacteria bacterium]|nr:hypothetical protein [Candidatus Parcubacteria bacterium]